MKTAIKTKLLKLGLASKKEVNKIFSEAITRLKNKENTCMCPALVYSLSNYLGYVVTLRETENLLCKYGYTRKNFNNYIRTYIPKHSYLLGNKSFWIESTMSTRASRISFLQYLIDNNNAKRITRKEAHKRNNNIYMYRCNPAKTWLNDYSSEQIKWLLDHKHLKSSEPMLDLCEHVETLYLEFTERGNFWYDWYNNSIIDFIKIRLKWK